MSVSRFSPGEITWSNLPERWRAQLINSASGFKPLVLLATHNSQNIDNLAVFSQLIHLGANPPLFGVLFRPDSVSRHTLENLQTQGMATVNAVCYADRRAAHQTSARYPADVSEFDAVGLKREFRPEWPVPFVHGCPVQWAVRLQTLLPISANGTQLAVLEVVHLFVAESGIQEDGYVDLAALDVATVNGLDAYHRTDSLDRLPYAKP
jgi:flavin reductase (DIM6/NTAB) family NADH-FMN oxidoreductase RutF